MKESVLNDICILINELVHKSKVIKDDKSLDIYKGKSQILALCYGVTTFNSKDFLEKKSLDELEKKKTLLKKIHKSADAFMSTKGNTNV